MSRPAGKQGEEYAERFLNRRGYRIIARNYQTAYGELDLVARKGQLLCVIEVKTRAPDYLAHPVEAVSRSKQRKIIRTTQEFIQRHRLTGWNVRFDVVTVLSGGEGQEPRIDLLENAFQADNYS